MGKNAASNQQQQQSLSLLIQIQTMIQAPMKPAQWIPFIRDMHRYEMNLGTFSMSNADDFDHFIGLAMMKSGLSPQYPLRKVGKNKFIFEAYYHTPKNAWLDVVT